MKSLKAKVEYVAAHLGEMLDQRRLVIIAALALVAAGIAVLLALIGQTAWLLIAGALILLAAAALSLIPHVQAQSLVEQSRNLIKVGQFQRALPVLNRAIELSPRLVNAYIVRSAAYAGLSQIDLAVEDAERAIKLAPRLPDTRLARARLYSYRGLHEDAIQDLRIGIRAKPDWAAGYMELAQLHVRLEDYESSLTTLRDLNVNISSEPVRYDSLILAGWVYEEKLKDLDGAIATYTRAIPLLPDRKIGYLRRAHAYRSRGDLHQASEDLLRAAQRIPTPEDEGQYHWMRAACYWGRYTITDDASDLSAWVAALERSIAEDAPSFSEQSRQWLALYHSKRSDGDNFDKLMQAPPPPNIFPN